MSNETIGEQRERVLSDTILSVEAIKQIAKGMAEQAGLTVLGGTCKDCKWWLKDDHEREKGICERVIDDDSPFYIDIDLDGYDCDIISKELVTPPTFACNQWEPKA